MKKIIAICTALVVIVSFFAIVGNNVTDGDIKNVSVATIEQNYNGASGESTTNANSSADSTTTTSSSGLGLGDLTGVLGDLGGSLGGDLLGGGGLDDLGSFGSAGEIFSDAGDVIGSILGNGNSSNNNNNNQNTVSSTQNSLYTPGYIDTVPAATYVQSQTTDALTETTSTSVSETESTSNENVDMGETSNPYKKPTNDIKPGENGEGVKWVQWMLQFTNYGLIGKTIDGVYDDETVGVVKKFQKEQGLIDDGVINSETVDKLEIMYYRYSMTFTTESNVTTTYPQITDAQTDEDDKGLSTGTIVAIISVIWCVAIAVVVVIIIIKKKKDTTSKESADKSSGKANGDMNLSDLFEEANKK